MHRAVFLDRDGVLTAALLTPDGKPSSPGRAAEMEILPEAAPACAALAAAGFMLICVTNQPEVARGRLDPGELDRMNDILGRELELDAVIDCRHDDADECPCRKPRPGMIIDAADRLDLDLSSSFTVGDRWRDIDAGNAAGTRAVWIDRGYSEELRSRPVAVVADVGKAAEWIVAQSSGSPDASPG